MVSQRRPAAHKWQAPHVTIGTEHSHSNTARGANRIALAISVTALLLGVLIGAWVGSRLEQSRYATETASSRSTIASIDSFIVTWMPEDAALADWFALAGVGRMRNPELPDAAPGFFPDTVRALAADVEGQYDVPAGVTLAQWALESGFGLSYMARAHHAYFGHTWGAVRRHDGVTGFVKRRDAEFHGGVWGHDIIRFATYRNIAASFASHGRYLSESGYYTLAFGTNNPDNFARLIAPHYASDPAYAWKLILIMRRYHLE